MKVSQKGRETETVVAAVAMRYAALFESRLFGIAISDGDEKIYRMNDTFLEIIGYTRNDFNEGKVTWSVITPQRYDYRDKQKVSEMMMHSVATTFDKEYIHKNGQAVPVAVGAELVSRRPPINVSFAIDITERKKFEKRKEEIIATIGHEIKTPLSVLRIQAELLISEIQEGTTPEKLIEQLREFDEHIHHMDVILSEILISDELRPKTHALSENTFDLCELVGKVIGDISLLSDREIVTDKADTNCFIPGNKVEMKEVITNLISNALKYSPDDTKVAVSVFRDQDTIRFSVQDWGRGIAKVDQKKIFQKSYQVRHEDTEREGTSKGIGLHLTKEIIKKHGGKIEVESALNEGSLFTCIFKVPKEG